MYTDCSCANALSSASKMQPHTLLNEFQILFFLMLPRATDNAIAIWRATCLRPGPWACSWTTLTEVQCKEGISISADVVNG